MSDVMVCSSRTTEEQDVESYINNEILISEVEFRPVLWDKTGDDYLNKKRKRDAWKEVCCIIKPDFEHLSSNHQKIISVAVEKRWRNLRDSFKKSIKEGEQCTGRKRRKRQYLYYDQLFFLYKLIDPQVLTPEPIINQFKIEKVKEEKPRNKIYIKPNDLETFSNTDGLDDHQQFFNSLLPIVRKLDDDQVLNFRAEVIALIQNIRRGIK